MGICNGIRHFFSETKRKVKKHFDKFIDISDMPDFEVSSLCKELQLDIAVNLTGHTLNARNNIFFNSLILEIYIYKRQ